MPGFAHCTPREKSVRCRRGAGLHPLRHQPVGGQSGAGDGLSPAAPGAGRGIRHTGLSGASAADAANGGAGRAVPAAGPPDPGAGCGPGGGRHQLRRLLPVAVGGHCRVPSRLSRHPGGAAGGQLYSAGGAGGSPAGGLLSHQPAAGTARMGAAEGRPADGHSPPYPPAGGGGPLPCGAAAAGALYRVSAGTGDR